MCWFLEVKFAVELVNFQSWAVLARMSKRGADSPPAGGAEPPTKKIVFEPLQLGRYFCIS